MKQIAPSGKYVAYPEYKDSGVGGLGLIPSHWVVMQLKRTVDGCTNGIWGSEPKNDGDDTIVLRVTDFDRPRLSLQDDGYTVRRIEETEKPIIWQYLGFENLRTTNCTTMQLP